MRVIQVSENGGPQVLKVVERERPVPQPRQLLIQTHAIGINFGDVLLRKGLFPSPAGLPFVPGYEASGVVIEAGGNCRNFKKGDPVMASLTPGLGAYSEYVCVDESAVWKIPEGVDFAVAGALVSQGLTAWCLLELAQASEKTSVLVHSAAGGVGIFLIQLAKLRGARPVIGAASTEQKRIYVSELGADHVVDYTAKGWGAKVREMAAGRGVDLVLDAVGGAIRDEGLSVMAPGGTAFLYGISEGTPSGLSAEQFTGLLMQNQSLRGFSMMPLLMENAEIVQRSWNALTKLYVDKKITVPLKTFPFEEAAKAHEELESRNSTGKLTLIVNH